MFPQPDSVEPVLGGQQFFRLKTQLASVGDIYESEVSALAFALGPDSDLARVQISSYNDASPGDVSQAIISPDRDIIGRIDARNEATYPGGRKGRILISLADIYDPNWRPDGFTENEDQYEIVAPILDVMQYFSSPPSIVPPRSDRTFRFQYMAAPAFSMTSWVAIPAYGRKSGFFTFKNLDTSVLPALPVKARIGGVRFTTSGPGKSPEAILYTGLFDANVSSSYQFKASEAGLWDYFYIGLSDGYVGGPFSIDLTLSDDSL